MIDYDKLGFRAGLEIHQQLNSHKLFCKCPSVLRNDEPDFEVKRKLHAVAGESGEIDVAAKYQASLNKEFIYQGYDTTCLVELDEEPPHEINSEALKIALQIAMLLNCRILPISQIMRKTVVNGSNTSGFQRSVILACDGFIETSEGKVGIDSVYLEEDSARQNGTKEGKEIYRLDRLGIPLIEISTKPDLKNAKHVKEAALKIGDILRSCEVRRGIGTIRQDLNISIKGSNRVEIKGFQEPKIMEKCVELEVLRQKAFLDRGEKNPSEVRGCLEDGSTEFLRPMPGADRMYPETDLELLRISKELSDEIRANLPQLKSEIEEYLRRHGLEEELIKVLFKSNKFDDFKGLFEGYGNARLIGRLLLVYPKDLAAKSKKSLEEIEKILDTELIGFILDKVNKCQLHEQDIKHVLELVLEGKDIKDAIIFEKKEVGEIEEKILKLIKDKPGLSVNAYMGLVMKEFKGQISGNEATEIIKKFVK